MSDGTDEAQSEGATMRPTSRRWVPWTLGGAGVAVVAGVVTFALLGGAVEPVDAVASPTSSVTPSVSPSVAPPVVAEDCLDERSAVQWVDGTELLAFPDDPWNAQDLGELRKPAGAGAADALFAATTAEPGTSLVSLSYPRVPGTQTQIAFVDGEAGTFRWSTVIDGMTAGEVIATPVSAGLDGVAVVHDKAAQVMVTLDLSDGTELARASGVDGFALVRLSAGDAFARAGIAAPSSNVLMIDSAMVLHALDARTLEGVWSIDPVALGVPTGEGGVPISIAGSIVAVGDQVFDAADGSPLGWRLPGFGLLSDAAGVVLFQEWLADGGVMAHRLDENTGRVCWSQPVLSVVADADTVRAVTADLQVMPVNPVTGELGSPVATVASASSTLGTVGQYFAEQIVMPSEGSEGTLRIHTSPGAHVDIPATGFETHGHVADTGVHLQRGPNGTDRMNAFSYGNGAQWWNSQVGRLNGVAGGRVIFAIEMTTIDEAPVWIKALR